MVTGVSRRWWLRRSQLTTQNTDDFRPFEVTGELVPREIQRAPVQLSITLTVHLNVLVFELPIEERVKKPKKKQTLENSVDLANDTKSSFTCFKVSRVCGSDTRRGGVGYSCNGAAKLVALSPGSRNRLQSSGKSGLQMFDVMQSTTTGGGGVYPTGSTGSRARDLGLRAQKKLLGRVVSTGAGRSLFIDDATTSLLDNLFKLMEKAAKTNPSLDKKQPEKVLKNIVKLSIKIGLLQRNQQLSETDEPKIAEIRSALRAAAMAVVSFYELEFSFDKLYLTRSLERCRSAILALIRPHLTDKSQDRCDQVFDFITNPEFLDNVFRQDSEHRTTLGLLVTDINKALDAGHL